MADNQVDISILCPLPVFEEGYTNPAPYNTKYDEDWAYPDTIPDFYEQAPYIQPFQQNDIIYLPLLANFGPHNIKLLDCSDNIIDSFVSAYTPTSIEDTGQKFYLASIALNTYPEGVYRFRIISGSPVLKTMVTGYFDLKAIHPGSILFQYTHDENDFNIPFESLLVIMLRTFGGFPPEQYKPGSDRTVFIDQPRNAVLLSGKTYDIDKLLIGDAGGVPKYLIKKINAIFDCSSVLIDGKQYVANDGATLASVTQDLYPMAGWGIDVRPAKNGTKKSFTADGNSNNPTTVVYNIEGDDFGSITGPASSNIIQIEQSGN